MCGEAVVVRMDVAFAVLLLEPWSVGLGDAAVDMEPCSGRDAVGFVALSTKPRAEWRFKGVGGM
jgi:hypothetical protein